MLRTKRVFLLAGVGLLSACADNTPSVNVWVGSTPTEGREGTSALISACPGMDNSRGLNLIGRTLYDLEVSLWNPQGSMVLRAWSPVHRGESRSTLVERLPGGHGISCEGTSLRTSLVPYRDGELLRWEMEIGLPTPNGIRVSTFRGEMPAVGNVFGASQQVVMDGRPMILRVSATRGAFGHMEDARVPLSRDVRHHATPLPDERLGRTLEDMRTDSERRRATRNW